MSMIKENFQLVADGFGRFITEYKLAALVFGILLYAFICWKKINTNREKYFLLYSAGMVLLLLLPVTAVLFLVYQTRFYDYEWVWSLVPLTGFLAWGIVTIVYNECAGMVGNNAACGEGKISAEGDAAFCEYKGSAEGRKKCSVHVLRICGFLAALLLILLSGNQGILLRETEEEQKVQLAGEKILQYMEETGRTDSSIIWGPTGVMQYLRSHNGEVELLYGRDMWDAKAGAYDYESYSEEEIACYNWMESVSASHNLYLIETDQITEQIAMSLADETQLKTAVENGVNLIVLPGQITPWVKRKFDAIAAGSGLTVSIEQVDEYTLWMLEQ